MKILLESQTDEDVDDRNVSPRLWPLCCYSAGITGISRNMAEVHFMRRHGKARKRLLSFLLRERLT